jgi:trimeric autotransporter adhesin
MASLQESFVNCVRLGKGNGSCFGNTVFGRCSLASNTGLRNTAVGYLALCANTSGCYNTAIGAQALRRNTTGIRNTAIGEFALAVHYNYRR